MLHPVHNITVIRLHSTFRRLLLIGLRVYVLETKVSGSSRGEGGISENQLAYLLCSVVGFGLLKMRLSGLYPAVRIISSSVPRSTMPVSI